MSSIYEKISAIRAFRSPNYRLFYLGQTVSAVGTWIQVVAAGWLIYRLTSSPIFLGAANFASNIPILFIAPFAGAIIDNTSSLKIIRITQALFMLITSLLAVLVLGSHIQAWHIIIANLAMGSISAFDMPARHSLLYHILDYKEDLTNAVALNSIMFNGGRMLGPAAAGFIIAVYGEGTCFLVNALSFSAILVCLYFISTNEKIKPKTEKTVLQNIQEGFLYVKQNDTIRKILFFIFITGLTTIPIMVLMPVFAKDIFRGGAEILGMLMGAIGIGALISAAFLASKKGPQGLPKIISIGALSYGLFIILLVTSATRQNLLLSEICAVIAGGSMILIFSGCNTIIQTVVAENMRGRVMSLYSMAFVGSAPLGSAFAGFLASRIGAPLTCQIGGIICLCAGIILLMKGKTIEYSLNQATLQQTPEKKAEIKTAAAIADSETEEILGKAV